MAPMADVTVAEEEYLQTLFWLHEVGLPMTGANLARAMQLSAPTVHEMVGRLIDAVSALERDEVLCQGLGSDFVAYYAQIKRSEHQRLAQAEDAQEFQRREYFARI